MISNSVNNNLLIKKGINYAKENNNTFYTMFKFIVWL